MIFRVNDGVKLSAKKLVALPQKKAEKKATFTKGMFTEFEITAG